MAKSFVSLLSTDQRLLNHSDRLPLSFGCKARGSRGGAHRSDTDRTVLTLEDGRAGKKKVEIKARTKKPVVFNSG